MKEQFLSYRIAKDMCVRIFSAALVLIIKQQNQFVTQQSGNV